MAALVKNSAGSNGLTVNALYVNATVSGDTAPTGTGVFLLVTNTAGSPITVTIAYPIKYDGDQTVAGRVFTVAATTGESVIPLRDIYRDPATGVAALTYSSITNTKVCVVQVP